MNVMEFKKIFCKLRTERNLTQGEAAADLGVSKSTVGMWETGKRLPSPELYEQIADYFNVDIDYLYGRTNLRQKIHYDLDGNPQRTLTEDESQLLDKYQKLNTDGKQQAQDYMDFLSTKYQKDGGLSGKKAV